MVEQARFLVTIDYDPKAVPPKDQTPEWAPKPTAKHVQNALSAASSYPGYLCPWYCSYQGVNVERIIGVTT